MRHCSLATIRNAQGAVALALVLMGAAEAPKQVAVPMGPGAVVGEVASYRVKAGDDVEAIATRFAVNPIRVTRPNKQTIADGLQKGEVVYVDLRHVQPRMDAAVSGIVLNVPEAEVYYTEGGRIVKAYPVGVSMSDWKAPIGTTQVVAKEKNPTWHVPKSIQHELAKKGLEVKTKVEPGPKNPLGVRWIGFADGTYGFHGTTEPGSIKRYASHGCVRMRKADVVDLYDRVEVGTPVRVYYQPLMLAVDVKAIWISVYPDIYDQHYNYKAALKHLAEQAQVTDRIDWKAVDRALEIKDGILSDVATTSQPSAVPASPEASH